MIFFEQDLATRNQWRTAMTRAYRTDETKAVHHLLDTLDFSVKDEKNIAKLATKLVKGVRKVEAEKSGVDALMAHYDLSTDEGVMLMCLAEALLRIPDKDTEDLLIQDKLTSANWQKHLGVSQSSFVNMATWGLALSGKVLEEKQDDGKFKKLWKGLVRRSGEPLIRQAVREAIKVMSHQFVIGRTIREALSRSEKMNKLGYLFSYDMLGEVALTQADADDYFRAYADAIVAVGEKANPHSIFLGPSISIKLSALFPRYEFHQYERAVPVLTDKLKELALLAKKVGVSLTVDAEEADRLDMSLDIFEAVLTDPELDDWQGLGLAVQSYQKRAFYVIKWLIHLGKTSKRCIRVRLVKGAYWDSEIKFNQVMGFSDYPVFTRKTSTDVSYLACAKLMLESAGTLYPQFATHNAYTVAAIMIMAADHSKDQFEFQNLQGMGKSLHDQVVSKKGLNIPCRIYAPVGSHEELLPYLVRRLLENGANSSFVNQIADLHTPIAKLIESPILKTYQYEHIPNVHISLPPALYGAARTNSAGLDFSDDAALAALSDAMEKFADTQWIATPHNREMSAADSSLSVHNPATGTLVGQVLEANKADVAQALQQSQAAFVAWDQQGPEARAVILIKMADLLEQHHPELMMIAVREAGKVLPDALSEIREAVDFCRYYATMAITTLMPTPLPGPTGETNELSLHGRGPMVCISPWNFPLAIFAGQVAAALVAGNTVIAKPAEQTPLMAARVVELFYQAGVPRDALILLPGRGEVIGAALTSDARIAGVLFTGSTDTAKAIQLSLANKPGPIVPLVAETGGMNAMIVDSSALLEQVVSDALASAFGSAGQRCSALRVLFIQADVAERFLRLLKGAMAELKLGDPLYLSTDIGPVIDVDAMEMLAKHQQKMLQNASVIYQVELDQAATAGHFFAPQAYELPDLSLLETEVFGPVLHVVRFESNQIEQVVDQINALGYGLTFGIQSRINETVAKIQQRICAGNVYVNRNMIGAVVGVQPFGGCHLSGTGPKAGGPHYLPHLCHEKTVTVDTTAAGGNASLMALGE